MDTFIINLKDGNPESITCLVCNMTSYNPNDIEYRYCGMCHEFHNNLKMKHMKTAIERQAEPSGIITTRRGRIAYMVIVALMVISAIIAFVYMAMTNKGLVAKFGVFWAAVISIATGGVGVLIGLKINKLRKK